MESSFIQRFRKISAVSLLESVLFCNADPSKISVSDMAIYHQVHYGISLTRQAIAKKFTKQATSFVKLLLEQLLKTNLCNSQAIFTHSEFNRILIKDSTSNQLPENLKDQYPGSGGAGSKASVRIQFEYDLKNLEVLELDSSAFNHQDIHNAKETLDNIRKDDLILRDMGYYSVDILKGIQQHQAWFICRVNPNLSVLDADTGMLLDFSAIEEDMRRNQIYITEKNVLLGEQKYPTRLVIEIVPDKIKQERLRKANKQARKKGRELSKDKKARFGLNLFLTNCSPKQLSAWELRRIYGIRWQIELVFKAWKQNSQFHKVKKMNIHRYEFLLYAKLVWVMLNWKIYQMLDIITYNEIRQRISILKLFKTLNQMKDQLKQIFRGDRDGISNVIRILECISYKHLLHQDRNNRINWQNVENI
ncbi:MAG: IS4 family transposase [Bacteroidetes bacterium]|jgi:hypothetical protein|nr:IS4 family transposase [Bacteroidota bacterium]